jgi:soluble lytic murein transglycosylase-like protein
MITRIQNTGDIAGVGSKLINQQKLQGTKASATSTTSVDTTTVDSINSDFSKLLFDAFRAQRNNNAASTQAKSASSAGGTTSASGSTSVDSLWNKTGVSVTDEELDRIFAAASEKYNVPVALLKAVAKAESDFNPNDVSSSGAVGIMQLMPETAKELGVTDSFDPEQNIMGGAKYLAQKLEQYDGNVELALAAYNAGSGNVAKYGGVPPFTETQNYIKKILAYMEENS